MSYSGRFSIDHAGIVFQVDLPGSTTTKSSRLTVSFPFEQIGRTLDPRALIHTVIARRVVDATRSLDEED